MIWKNQIQKKQIHLLDLRCDLRCDLRGGYISRKTSVLLCYHRIIVTSTQYADRNAVLPQGVIVSYATYSATFNVENWGRIKLSSLSLHL